MEKNKSVIRIIGTDACPLYDMGDEFRLSGTSLHLPYGKAACLILIKDLTNLLLKYDTSDAESRYVFQCSGCSGMIRLEYRHQEQGQLPLDDGEREKLNILARSLSDYTFFQTFDEAGVRHLLSKMKKQQYQAGEIVIRKGDPGQDLFIIVSGRVEIFTEGDVRVAILGKGEVFGEMSLLSGEPVVATVRAIEPLQVFCLNGDVFQEMLHQFPSVQIYLTRLLARRITLANIVRSREIASGLTGNLSEIPPSELFQILHLNQKTGVLVLKLPGGLAAASFRDGSLIRVKYNERVDQDAFFEILKAREGRFKFNPELPPEETRQEEIGNFMKLLLEGARMADEAGEGDNLVP